MLFSVSSGPCFFREKHEKYYFFYHEKPRKQSKVRVKLFVIRENFCKLHTRKWNWCTKQKHRKDPPLKTFRLEIILKISAMKLFALAVERFEKMPVNRKYNCKRVKSSLKCWREKSVLPVNKKTNALRTQIIRLPRNPKR